MKKFIAFDFETTSTSNPQVYSWGMMDEDENFSYGISIESFVEKFLTFDENYIMFAHNGAKFDLHFLLPILNKMGFKQKEFFNSKKTMEVVKESQYKSDNTSPKFSLHIKPKEYTLLADKNKKEAASLNTHR